MIQISKEQAEYLRKKMPSAPIKRTTNKFYTEDTMAVRNTLRRMPVKAVRVEC